LPRVALEFLTQPDWRCILKMRSSDLDDLVKCGRFGSQRTFEPVEGGYQSVHDGIQCSDMQRCRNYIVARLSHIDMIIRMNRFPGPDNATQNLNRSIGYDFVRIHVGRSTGTRLEDIQNELFVELAICNFSRGPNNRMAHLLIE